jgi:glucose/mannose-6-phosphate isomerase
MAIEKFIEKYDPENQFNVLKNSYEQADYVLGLDIDLNKIDSSKIKSVIVAGLGGSAIGGDVVQNLFHKELTLPYFVSRNYNLPSFADESSLVILSSYSGNTEETLSSAKDALNAGAQIVCITTGGKLEQLAAENNLTVVKLKEGYQPRFALYMNMLTVAKTLAGLNIITMDDEFLISVSGLLKERSEEYEKENNYALNIAESLAGFVPVIYSCDGVSSAVGVRLKGQFNENAKSHAFHNSFPELNHNEIIGWETQSETLFRTKAIIIDDESYHPQIARRIKITSELIEKSSAKIIALKSSLNSFKFRMLDIIYLGDWITYYLAVIRGKNPSEIDFIHHLKKELDR